jgi:ribosomal protein S18 acetylase RimI-like enzyme
VLRHRLEAWAPSDHLNQVATKVVTTFYRRVVVVARSLDDTLRDYRPRLPVDIALLTEGDVVAFSAFRPDRRVELVRARLADGQRCFVAQCEGQIVHAAWVATGLVDVPYLRRSLVVPPGSVYIHDSYTLPAFRGHGLAPACRAYLMRHCMEQGYRQSLAVVAAENEAAFRALRKVGVVGIGLYGCLRLGPWQRDWQQCWGAAALPALLQGR